MCNKLFVLVFLCLSPISILAQVESTTSGGPWTSVGTWKDGVVPAPGDNVLIKGPVTLDLITFSNGIQITNTGSLAPEIITATTYKLYVANYLWNNGIINGYNLEIYIGGNQAGSIYNQANGNWHSGTVFVVDTLSHAFLSEGKAFSPFSVRADSATLVSAGNITIDSTSVYARKIILGQNLQNEKFTLDHSSVLHVEEFINIPSDTSGLEFKNNSYISSSPISGTSTRYTDTYFKGDVGIGTNVSFYGNCFLNGNMYPQFSNAYTITSSGLFQNNGEIKPKPSNSAWQLSFDIWGDLISNGNWTSNTIRMMGTSNHIVLTDPNFTFSPSNFTALTSTITISTAPLGNNHLNSSFFLRFDNSTVQIMKLILDSGSSLNLVSNSSLAVKQLIGNGNVVKFINNSYLSRYSSFGNSSFENVHFTGNVGIGANQTFNGNCILSGNMYPQFSNSYTVTSNGLFQNNGEIKPKPSNPAWQLSFDINGNLTNNGPWLSNTIRLPGTANHIVEIDTSYSFAPSNFQSDSSTVLSNSNLRFDNSSIRIKHLTLQNSHNLILNNSHFSGAITGNGNEVSLNNNSYLSRYSGFGNSSFENVNFTGNVGIGANQTFNGDCIVNGNMYPQFSNSYTITSNGLFQNNGKIKPEPSNSAWQLSFDINGALENAGYWVSSVVNIQGLFMQHIGIEDTASIDNVKVYANRGGNSFQWTLNGSALTNGGDISGATSSTLTINNFDSKFFGTLKCDIDSSGNAISSRNIIVNDVVTDVEIRDDGGNGDNGKDGRKNQTPKIFALSQNYPNPFNPTTTIGYQLPKASRVTLIIYNVLGQQVKALIDKEQSAGYYTIVLDASSLSSGVYFYRISTTDGAAGFAGGGFVRTKKMILLK